MGSTMSEHDTANQTGAEAQRDGMAQVRAALRSIVRRARALLVAERLFLALAPIVAAALAVTALDFFLRLPQPLRVINWIIGIVALALLVARWVLPAARFHPSPTDVALRIERRRPDLKGLLASGFDFAEASSRREDEPAFTRALSQRVVQEAVGSWKREAARGLLRWRPALRSLALLAAPAAIALGAAALWPHGARVGAMRTLAPWSDAAWPKRTGVVDVTSASVHPLGQALPLRAAVTRSPRAMDRTDVFARWRPIVDGSAGAEQRALMTWQARKAPLDGADAPGASPDSGDLFERLVEADADFVEYRFETDDDRTEWRRVALVEPPSVVGAEATVTPPDYAARLMRASDAEARSLAGEQRLDMGRGLDERAIAPPALVGARVELTLRLNKPAVAAPQDQGWILATLGVDALSSGVQVEVGEDPSVWTLRWTLAGSTRLPVTLRDEHGIESVLESVFRFQAVEDAPPSVAILTPESDRAVLPTATATIEGEARDDVGLEAIWITRQRHQPAGEPQPSGPGGALAPSEDPVEIARAEQEGARALEAAAEIDLSTLGLSPGDEVWVQALATDVFSSADEEREPSRSTVRRLLIISETEFVEQIRGALSGVRQAAISIDEQQRAVREQAERDGATREARRGQAQISDRIDREAEQLENIVERVETNALDDPDLQALIEAAGDALEQAGRRSNDAAERLDEAGEEAQARGASPDEAMDEREQREVEDAQREVEDRLTQVAELLDRGEDAWVLKRRLEGLLEEQQDLREETDAAGGETTGKAPEELTEEERSELERIAQKQRELAERTREAIDELREGAERLREQDPATAQGLSQAARRAEERDAQGRMQEAAEQAEQNRTARAGRAQEQAEEALEEMLEDLEQSRRAREEVLRRLLLSLIDSIEALINDQERAIESLEEAIAADAPVGDLDQAMVRLNRNTLGVLDQAKGGGPELVSVASLIGRAGEAQTRAIIALRDDPPDAPLAGQGERESLDLLIQARDEAERLEEEMQQREQDRKRRELREAYREQLKAQIDLRDQSSAYPDAEELTRRQRAQVRDLAEPQGQVRSALNELRESMEEIGEAGVFDYAHRRLDELTGEAQRALEEASAPVAVQRQRRAVAILRGLVDAMEQAQRDEEDFRRNEGGGGGGGGGQQGGDPPLIPDLAELRLLRQMQADLAQRTREADETPEQVEPARVQQLGDEQANLADLGKDLVERLQQNQGGPPVPPPPGDAPPEEQQP